MKNALKKQRMQKCFPVFLFLFLVLTQQLFSQPFADKKYYLVDSLDLGKISASDRKLVDSCLKIYHTAAADTTRLKQLAYIARDVQHPRLIYCYASLMRKDALAGSVKKGIPELLKKRMYDLAGTADHLLGFYYSQVVRNDSISEYYNLESIDLHTKAGKRNKAASDLLNLAGNYSNEGKVTEALACFQSVLAVYEELGDSAHMGDAYQNIGFLLQNQDDTHGALQSFRKALKMYEAVGMQKDAADVLSFIGGCYKTGRKYDSAMVAYNRADTIFRSLDNEYGIATILLNKGELLQEMGMLEPALESCLKSREIFERIGDKNPLSFVLNSLATIYYKKGDLVNARMYGERSLKIANEIHYPDNIRNAARLLSRVYKSSGDYKNALAMHELYSTMNDSILNADTKRNAIEKDLKYQHDKELLEVQKEREKETVAAEKEKEKRNIIIAAASGGLLLLTVFLLFLYNRFRLIRSQKNIIEVQKAEVEAQKYEIGLQKDLVENKNHEIMDSINYAKRLQQAILPQEKMIAEYLPDSFVLYKPKDIVAGDFYWIEKVGDEVIIAAADCTGHGVPGAMVSFVCVNALNRAVLEYGLTQPGAILGKVSELVVQSFQRSESEVKDGMDISLCSYHTKTKVLQYAGAYNPIWILKKDALLEEYVATKQAIGNVINPVPFVNNVIPLSEGDSVYMYSDGFADQFGGEKGKKLKYSNFKKMIADCAPLPMAHQKEQLDKGFEAWRGELEQVDDVCVMGFRAG